MNEENKEGLSIKELTVIGQEKFEQYTKETINALEAVIKEDITKSYDFMSDFTGCSNAYQIGRSNEDLSDTSYFYIYFERKEGGDEVDLSEFLLEKTEGYQMKIQCEIICAGIAETVETAQEAIEYYKEAIKEER